MNTRTGITLGAALAFGLALELAAGPCLAQTATRTPRANPDALPASVPRFPRGVRIALELVTTNLVGAAGAAAGYYIAYGFSDCVSGRNSNGCNLAIGLGVGVGSVFGAVAGASAGYLMDGDGSAWASLLGASIGAVPLSIGLAAGLTGPALILLLPTPYLGAMLGFELTSRDYVGAPERRHTRWIPGLVPTPGGAMATLGGMF